MNESMILMCTIISRRYETSVIHFSLDLKFLFLQIGKGKKLEEDFEKRQG